MTDDNTTESLDLHERHLLDDRPVVKEFADDADIEVIRDEIEEVLSLDRPFVKEVTLHADIQIGDDLLSVFCTKAGNLNLEGFEYVIVSYGRDQVQRVDTCEDKEHAVYVFNQVVQAWLRREQRWKLPK